MVVKNGFQLGIDAVFDNIRRIFTINPVHLFIYEVAKLFGGMLNFWRKEILRQKFNLFACIGNGTRCINHDFFCNFFPEIAEFLQHLAGGAEEDRAGTVTVRILLRSKQDMAILFIFRIQEVHIGRCNDGFAQALTEVVDPAIPGLELRLVLCTTVFN